MAFCNHNNNQTVNIGPANAPTLANVTASASSVPLFASNHKRIGAILVNDSSATLYLKYGDTASTTDYSYKILGNQTWEMPDPVYTGLIDGIWDSATGTARCTELT